MFGVIKHCTIGVQTNCLESPDLTPILLVLRRHFQGQRHVWAVGLLMESFYFPYEEEASTGCPRSPILVVVA